ncbi:2-oxoglutarate and iron-dependent oxygenase JMJD4 [Rhodamnia argentea]|uniref:2-oxoglutarate and iron-dependent oxygenase JMJD4 n=1 Tax=Rhodamnia argentea TaxID=178133 RepID=A0A8B8PBQ1_9MYRT|nr:2-oxoglutarate and iron-dependent oxygenase JMJD4 [Rhodamnia argentea]
MGLRIAGHIERLNGKELTYQEFVERYLRKNQPVVLTGLMDDWRACKDWVTRDGRPNLPFFAAHFGKSRVQVADCGTREFTDQKRVEMSVSEFAEHWLMGWKPEESEIPTSDRPPVLYLKDWHFVKDYPDYVAYTTPVFFRDDWLNLYLDCYRMHMDPEMYQETDDISCSDYRFVYMGAKGSWTPLHADVFRSCSWSANVCGKKQWLFLSPSQCDLVFDRNMKNCVYDIFSDASEMTFPGFKETIWTECIQEENEIIFVPSGWYHQVQNLEDTISINHNWFNAHNLSWIWDLLSKDYDDAKEYIEDIRDICDDFEGLCQRNLAANTGMNFYDFLIFITRFALAYMGQLYYLLRGDDDTIQHSSLTVQQLALNLASIRKVATKMKDAEGFQKHRDILDTEETLSDPKFSELSIKIGNAYRMMLEPSPLSYYTAKACVDVLGDFDFLKSWSPVCTPGDLVSCIDDAVENLNRIGSKNNIHLGELV